MKFVSPDNLITILKNFVTVLKENTQDIVYYIDPNGNDNNDGLTLNSPVKTFAKIALLIPKECERNYAINIRSGTYQDSIVLQGYSGSGSIRFIVSDYIIPDIISIYNNTCKIYFSYV